MTTLFLLDKIKSIKSIFGILHFSKLSLHYPPTCFSAIWSCHLFAQGWHCSLYLLNLGISTVPSQIRQKWLVSSRSSPWLQCAMRWPNHMKRPRGGVALYTTAELPVQSHHQLWTMWSSHPDVLAHLSHSCLTTVCGTEGPLGHDQSASRIMSKVIVT